MRVMMLAPGHSRHALRPLSWLLEQKVEVVLVDYDAPGPEVGDGYRCVGYPRLRAARLLGRVAGARAASRLQQAWSVRRLRRLAEEIRPDLVHVHFVDRRAFCAAQAGLRPLVLSVWGSDVNRLLVPGADPELSRMAAFALSWARLVIVDAPDMPEKCERLAGRALSILTLPLGVDGEAFRPGPESARNKWRSRLGIPEGAPVLVSMRAWDPLYAHDAILRAFAHARRHLPPQTVLVFKRYNPARARDVGEALTQEIGALAERLGVTPWIRFLDEVRPEELPEIYALADVVVNFPRMDAFPITFQEAAACRCLLISNRLPAYEGTFAERFFPMVASGDENGLSELMVESVLGLAEGRTRLPPEAREEILRHFDERETARRLLEAYDTIAPGTREAIVGARA
jgi:L-malate glycosyltransferase